MKKKEDINVCNSDKSLKNDIQISGLSAIKPAISNIQQIIDTVNNISNSPGMKALATNAQQMNSLMNNFYSSPGMKVLVDNTQQMANLMNTVSISPGMKSLVNNSEQMINLINNLYSSPAMKILAANTQQMINLISTVSTSPGMKLLIDNSNQMTDTIKGISESPALKSMLKDPQQIEDIINEISTSSLADIMDNKSNDYIFEFIRMSTSKEVMNSISNKNKIISKKEVILFLLGWLLPILINPFIQPYIEHYNSLVDNNRNKIVKIIKKEIKQSHLNNIFKNNRIIKKNNLQIKKADRNKSITLGVLDLGEIVEVVYKKRNWTKIKTRDKKIIGWVYTRYLEKIE